MSRIRGKNTQPEMEIRRELWHRGYRYRISLKLPGKPDIVFPRERVAVFLDGCFWHRCPDHFQAPSQNANWWCAKISRNVERDREVNATLKREGWTVLRFWEHEVKKSVSGVVRRITHRIHSIKRRTASRMANKR